jgi:2-keto-4-pentenoate hydratase/2-oxohepta-3-ene-1,7-dioic acid hydratase in catechol pathway
LQGRLKEQGLPWERAKAFDGAALFSEFVPLPADWSELGVELDINNAAVQRGDTGLMLYKPDAILTEIVTFMSLNDGDIVMTGTPGGVGPVSAGDEFTGSIMADGRLLVSGSWTAK